MPMTSAKKRAPSTLCWIAAVALASLPGGAVAQRASAEQESSAQLEWWPVRANVWMTVGAGASIAASVGPDGVLLVNSGDAESGEHVYAAVLDLEAQLNALGFLDGRTAEKGGAETRSRFPVNTHAPPKPIRYIINTSGLPHNVGANELLASRGITYSGGNVAGTIADSAVGAAVLAHENVLVRMVAAGAPFGRLPTETYFTKEYKLSTFFNGEGIRIVHIPNASTDGDSIVYFRGSDVIAAGDLFNMDTFPLIDVDQGGSIDGVIYGLNYILNLAIPEFRTEGGTMVIPSRGRLADSADVGYYRDMLTIIRDQVQDLIDRGMTLEQVLRERPTFGYEGRFGSETGPWTTEMFITAVYRSLEEGQN
jgi:glyoxylase-like metal-dependent hydrolase (beta-lactamase superfamily II)